MESETDDNELQFFLDESSTNNTNTNNHHANFSSLGNTSQYDRQDNHRFGAMNPIANQLVKYSKNKKKHKRSYGTSPQKSSLYTLEKLQASNHNVKIYHGNQQNNLTNPQQNIKRRRVNVDYRNDVYSRFYASTTTASTTTTTGGGATISPGRNNVIDTNTIDNNNNQGSSNSSNNNNNGNTISPSTKTKGIRIEPTPAWLRQKNSYHHQSNNSYHDVSSISSSSSSSYLVESWDNHRMNQQVQHGHHNSITSSLNSSIGSSPMQHPTPPNLIGAIGIHALKSGNSHLINSAPQFVEHRHDNNNNRHNVTPVNSFTISNAMITSDTSNHTIIINNNNNSNVGFNSFISRNATYNNNANSSNSNNNNDSYDDEMMETTFDNNNNSNSNSSVSSPSTNNLINPANAALTPGFVDRSRKSIGPTFFSSIHLQGGKGNNYKNNSNTNAGDPRTKLSQQQINHQFSVTSRSPCAPLREGITQMEIQ